MTAVARSGHVIAFASAPAAGDCERVRLWDLGTHGVLRLGEPKPCGDTTSTGLGLAGLAVARSRALWVAYVGGNTREWSLWTATASSRRPRLIRLVGRDVDDPQPLVVGDGAGVLPWALDATVTSLGTDGAAVFRTTLPSPVRLLAAYGGTIAGALADGDVTTLSPEGDLRLRARRRPVRADRRGRRP